jgi:predicted phage-related endonuclease
MVMSSSVVLGGSTLPAACGLDPYCSPIRLWLRLTGREQPEPTEAMWWGQRDQAVILERLHLLGWPTVPGWEWYDAGRSWLIGHTDAHLVVDGGEPGPPVEVKSMAHAADAVRVAQEAQLQTYVHLAGADGGLLARRVGHHLEVAELERDQRAIDALLRLGEEFVGYVERDEQPPVSGHPDDRGALVIAYPGAEPGKVRRETREVRDARRELRALMDAEKARKARMEHLRAVISEHIGDAETLVTAHDEPVASWKSTTTRRFNGERLKAERPELYESYRDPSTGRTLRLG